MVVRFLPGGNANDTPIAISLEIVMASKIDRSELEAHLEQVKQWLSVVGTVATVPTWLDRFLGWLQRLLLRRH
jgi:hypothetical protein